MTPKLFYKRFINTPFKRLLFWLSVGFGLFTLALVSGVYLMQDQLIQRFIHDANKHLAVKVHAPQIKVTALPNFPDVSIAFNQLVIYGSNPAQPDTLAHFQTIYFTFNVLDLINGNYQLHQLYAENGGVNLQTDKKGIHNFKFTKSPKHAESTANQHFSLHLNRIRLKNIDFLFQYHPKQQHYHLKLEDVVSKLSYRNDIIETTLEGKSMIHQITLEKQHYAENKALHVNSFIQYQPKEKTISIYPSSIKIGQGKFNLEGVYEPSNQQHLYLKLDGKNTNFNTLLAFSPQGVRTQLSTYNTKGKAYFSAVLDGKLNAQEQPHIQVAFGCHNVSLTHPDYDASITNLAFQGTFNNGKQRQLSSATLQLDSIQGLLKGQAFSGNFSLYDFRKPIIAMQVNTRLNLRDIVHFYPIEALQEASGILTTNLKLAGDLTSTWNFKATGHVACKTLTLKAQNYPHTLYIDSTLIELKRQQLVIHPTSGKIADSDFNIQGKVNNWNQLLQGKWQTLVPHLRIQSERLNFNQLLSISPNSSTHSGSNQTNSFPKFSLDLAVNELIYDTWHAKAVRGAITSEAEEQIRFVNLGAKLFDGTVVLDGLLELDEKASMYAGNAQLHQINVRSLFQTFNDFDLDAISYKNLEGELNAHLAAQLIFDQQWNTQWHLMDAVIAGNIRNGKLLQYEPMLRLASFMQNKDLENISFSELSDTIFINQNVMTLPRMEIRSSIGNMFIRGTQEIDGNMEYHVQIPLKNFKKPDKDEAFGAIEDDGLGNGNLFLVIKGTPSDYKIAYDKKEVVNKIKKDLKKEKKEFSSLFKKKQKAKQVGLKEDYF
ncbi:MAG: AsmA-like C-terminal region-containing protein [Flammeovirgaceae bacterium]